MSSEFLLRSDSILAITTQPIRRTFAVLGAEKEQMNYFQTCLHLVDVKHTPTQLVSGFELFRTVICPNCKNWNVTEIILNIVSIVMLMNLLQVMINVIVAVGSVQRWRPNLEIIYKRGLNVLIRHWLGCLDRKLKKKEASHLRIPACLWLGFRNEPRLWIEIMR